MEASRSCCNQAAVARRRRSRRGGNDLLASRVSRAEALELSSAREALEGGTLALGSEAILNAVRDPTQRPADLLPRQLSLPDGRLLFELDERRFARNLRSAKRGAAGGLLGMTVEHLQLLLDHSRDPQRFFHACDKMARAQVPNEIREAIRLGRLTALQKPQGGVRGIVAGDIARRVCRSS